MNKSAIYWGTFLISIGFLLLIKSLGAMTTDFQIFIRLWPLFLIFWGLSIIKFPEFLRKILIVLSAVFLALFLFAIFTNGWSFSKHHIFRWHDDMNYEKTIDKEQKAVLIYDSTIKKASLNLDFGAGKFILVDTTSKAIEANGENFTLSDIRDSGKSSHVNINIDGSDDGKYKKEIRGAFNLNLKLNRQIEWYIDADFGAAEADIDLSPFFVPSLNINSGASSLKLTLGNASALQSVSIDCGASDIFIRIPKESGCRLYSNTFLSGRDYEGFTESDGGYVTGNYKEAANKIDIRLNGAISNFNIVKY